MCRSPGLVGTQYTCLTPFPTLWLLCHPRFGHTLPPACHATMPAFFTLTLYLVPSMPITDHLPTCTVPTLPPPLHLATVTPPHCHHPCHLPVGSHSVHAAHLHLLPATHFYLPTCLCITIMQVTLWPFCTCERFTHQPPACSTLNCLLLFPAAGLLPLVIYHTHTHIATLHFSHPHHCSLVTAILWTCYRDYPTHPGQGLDVWFMAVTTCHPPSACCLPAPTHTACLWTSRSLGHTPPRPARLWTPRSTFPLPVLPTCLHLGPLTTTPYLPPLHAAPSLARLFWLPPACQLRPLCGGWPAIPTL